MRLQLMLAPGRDTPMLPALVKHATRIGHNLMTVIDETDSALAISWAQELIGAGVAEEYALGATSLEDAYVQMTGHETVDRGGSG